MTTILTIKDADFSANAIGFSPPVTSGLIGWWYLGGTQALTEKDLSFTGNATLAGSPTIEDEYVSFGGASTGQYLQTTLADPVDISMLVVARTSATFGSAAQRPMYIGNYGADSGYSNTQHGAGIYTESGTAPSGVTRASQSHDITGTVTPSTSPALTIATLSSWNFMCSSYAQSGGAKRFRCITTAQSGTATQTATRVPHTTNKLRIGASFNSSVFGGACDVAFAAVYNVALTTNQEDAIYEFVARFMLDRRSITI